jgi:hypothetical protein
MKRTSQYANMTASDLARITRERGLEKPNVITLSEWADFLEANDAKREKAAQTKDSVRADDADTEPVDNTRAQKTTDDTPARAKSGSAKGAK